MKRKESWSKDPDKPIEIPDTPKKLSKDSNKGLMRRIRQYLQEYCNSSSIHGIRYMGEKGRSGTERVWWIVIFIASIAMCTHLIMKTYTKWQSSPVIVSFAQSPTPVWQVPFPAVTICSETKARQSVFNFTEAYHTAVGGNLTDLSPEELKKFQDVSLICDTHLYSEGNKTTDHSSIDFIHEVAPQFEEMIWQCKWTNRLNSSCSDLFSPMLTEEGLCYTFNMLDSPELFTTELIPHTKAAAVAATVAATVAIRLAIRSPHTNASGGSGSDQLVNHGFNSQRRLTAIMVCLGLVATYIMRVQVNFSITVMTHHNTTALNATSDSCNFTDDDNSTLKQYGNLSWSLESQNILLGTFYYGYMVTQIPFGIVADKYGAKYPYGTGVAVVAVCHIFTPLVIKWGGDYVGYYLLCTLRVLQGIGSACVFPLISPFVAAWIPPLERGKFGTLMYTGGQFGCFLSFLFSGYLTTITESWEFPFYVFGGIALAWFLLFQIYCHSSYEQHPYLSEKELQLLRETIPLARRARIKIPWKSILISRPFWALIALNAGTDFSLYLILNELPTYMKTYLKLNVNKNAVASAIPYLFQWMFAMTGGAISDCMLQRNCTSVTKVRKIFVCGGFFGTALFVILAIYVGCHRIAVIVMFCLTMGFTGACTSAWVNFCDVAPTYAGTISGIANTIGACQGFISAAICSAILKENTYKQWQYVFWMSFIVASFCGIFYAIFGSGVREQWDIDGAAASQVAQPRKSTQKEVPAISQEETVT